MQTDEKSKLRTRSRIFTWMGNVVLIVSIYLMLMAIASFIVSEPGESKRKSFEFALMMGFTSIGAMIVRHIGKNLAFKVLVLKAQEEASLIEYAKQKTQA